MPRTPDGKPNLTAPAPRAAERQAGSLRRLDASSARPLAEMKRLFGDNVGAANVPGMEVETVSKYAINILLDFKPERVPDASRSRGNFSPARGRRRSLAAPACRSASPPPFCSLNRLRLFSHPG